MNIRYTDEQLDYYGDRFVALDLKAHGVTFLQYLARPARYEAIVNGEVRSNGQIDELIERVERPIQHLARRNGAAVEPLHHCAHPRRSNRGFFKKSEVQS